MLSRKSISYLISIGLLGIVLIQMSDGKNKDQEPNQDVIRFPFEVKLEKTYSLTSLHEATVFISIKHYSMENLSKLFRWYMKKYPKREEPLKVDVYLNDSTFDKESSIGEKEKLPVASFFRERGTGEYYDIINAWYYYDPDPKSFSNTDFLERLDRQKLVVLFGGNRLQPKKVVETWENSNHPMKIKVTCYEMASEHISPKGFYYNFDFCPVKTAPNNNCSTFMIFRQDKLIPIPKSQVRLLNDQVAYAFMGWLYAVTIDGGKSWSTWDAEVSLANWQCCDSTLIQEVKITLDGLGIMTLNPNPNNQQEVISLRTQDYGKTWKAD